MTEPLKTVKDVEKQNILDRISLRAGQIAIIGGLATAIGAPLWSMTVSQPIADTQRQVQDLSTRFEAYTKAIESQLKTELDKVKNNIDARFDAVEKQAKSAEEINHQIRRDIAIQSERILNLTKSINEFKEHK